MPTDVYLIISLQQKNWVFPLYYKHHWTIYISDNGMEHNLFTPHHPPTIHLCELNNKISYNIPMLHFSNSYLFCHAIVAAQFPCDNCPIPMKWLVILENKIIYAHTIEFTFHSDSLPGWCVTDWLTNTYRDMNFYLHAEWIPPACGWVCVYTCALKNEKQLITC